MIDPQEKVPSTESESDDSKPSATPPLTPEEQMAAFEEDLKESDWGHQPC